MTAEQGCILVPREKIFNSSEKLGQIEVVIGTMAKWLEVFDRDHSKFCNQNIYLIALFQKYMNLR